MRLILGILVLSLTACGATVGPPPTPIVETVVVTQVVQVEVTVEVTREVAVTVTPPPATATPRVTPTPRATPTPEIGGDWEITTDTSAFDGSPRVVFALRADKTVQGGFEQVRPVLFVRCQEKETEVFIDLGTQADVEDGNLDNATVRLRIGDEPAETLNPGKSTDNMAVFFDGPKALIARLAAADTLLFGFTPFSAAPVETTFDLRGLADILPQLEAACA